MNFESLSQSPIKLYTMFSRLHVVCVYDTPNALRRGDIWAGSPYGLGLGREPRNAATASPREQT